MTMAREVRTVPTNWTAKKPTDPLAELPTDPDSDDYWFARHMVGLSRTGAMFHGRFVEVHLARILGAHLPTTGINEWDLLLPGNPPIRIEVKTTTGERGSFNIAPKASRGSESDSGLADWPKVWVFVHAPDRRSRDFTYLVASDQKVGDVGRSTITHHKATRTFRHATADVLLETVRTAARHETG